MYIILSSFHTKYFHPLLKIFQPFLPHTEFILLITGHCHSFFLDMFWVVEPTLKMSIICITSRNCYSFVTLKWQFLSQGSMNPTKPGKALCAGSHENKESFIFVLAIVALYEKHENHSLLPEILSFFALYYWIISKPSSGSIQKQL